jgi:alpha-glucoside transport system substrate-binding protein
MFQEPPGCWLYHQASFASGLFPVGIEPGRDAAAFAFPSINPEHKDAIVGGGNYLVAFADRPEVRVLVRYMLGPQYGQEMARQNPGYIFPHRDFPQSAYQFCNSDDPATRECVPNEFTQALAHTVRQALDSDTFRFDGSDLMPPSIGQGIFWSAMVDFEAAGPDNLDELLAMIEAEWAEVEDQSQ